MRCPPSLGDSSTKLTHPSQVYVNSPATSSIDVSKYANWLDPWRHSQLTPEGKPFVVDSTWSRQSYDELRQIMLWAMEASPNSAINLRVPGAKAYTYTSLGTHMAHVIEGRMSVDELVAKVTTEWNLISDAQGRLKQLEVYRAGVLFAAPLSLHAKCTYHRAEMNNLYGLETCSVFDVVVSCPRGEHKERLFRRVPIDRLTENACISEPRCSPSHHAAEGRTPSQALSSQ